MIADEQRLILRNLLDPIRARGDEDLMLDALVLMGPICELRRRDYPFVSDCPLDEGEPFCILSTCSLLRLNCASFSSYVEGGCLEKTSAACRK